MNEQVRNFRAADRAQVAFTVTDFLRMMELGAFDDMRAELVGGELQKMMPAYMAHGEQNARTVSKLIDAYAGSDVRVAVDLAIRIDDVTVRGADIAIVVRDLPRGTPAAGDDLLMLVEISDSSLQRDLGLKMQDYANAGVATYWVIDLAGRGVYVMSQPVAGDYVSRELVRFGEPLTVPGTNKSITID